MSEKTDPELSGGPTKVVPPHDRKSWLVSALMGFFTGLAVIVPGISGATIAIIFRLYQRIVLALSTFFSHFRSSFLFLLPILIGGIIGFVVGFFGIDFGLKFIPFALVCLFAGLMAGAFPAVTDEIKDEKKTPIRWALLIVGFLVPVIASFLIASFTPLELSGNASDKLIGEPWWFYLIWVLIGFVIAITQLVPGLSASAFLMAIGYFNAIYGSFSLTFWQDNPIVFAIYAAIGVGFLVGLFASAKGLSWLFGKYHARTFFAVVGLSLGSIVAMFYNPEIMTLYLKWAGEDVGDSYAQSVPMAWDIGIGAALLIVGFAVAYALVLYQRRHAEAKQKA